MIDLPKIFDVRGNLTVAEEHVNVPFGIRRVYWVYDVPGGESRGGHAHKKCKEFIIAVSGSFTVTLDNGSDSDHLVGSQSQLLCQFGTSFRFPESRILFLHALHQILQTDIPIYLIGVWNKEGHDGCRIV